MSRYITLETYTNQGAAGLVDGDSECYSLHHKVVSRFYATDKAQL